jgi:hypothetical protein
VVAVGKLVEKELKGILQKDINKKLCESYAFLLFDKWWADKVQQFSAIVLLQINREVREEINVPHFKWTY